MIFPKANVYKRSESLEGQTGRTAFELAELYRSSFSSAVMKSLRSGRSKPGDHGAEHHLQPATSNYTAPTNESAGSLPVPPA